MSVIGEEESSSDTTSESAHPLDEEEVMSFAEEIDEMDEVDEGSKAGPLRTKNEILLEEMDPVEKMRIQIEEDVHIHPLG